MMYVNDGTEFSIGGKKSGIVIRYRGLIRGLMIVIRNEELSYMNYRGSKLSWNHIIRIPFKQRALLRW